MRLNIVNWFKKFTNKKFSPRNTAINETSRRELIFRFSTVYFLILLFAIIIVAKTAFLTIQTPKFRLSKNIKYDLEKAILLDCNYEDLKIIFDKKERVDIRKPLIRVDDFYVTSVDLASILEDLVFDYYSTNKKDSIYISKVKHFIKESKEKDPFDKLDESQKELFITLRENSGESYNSIKENLLSISEELCNKNETIQLYLDKSNQSYILAIVALLLTILQITPQIWKKVKYYMSINKKVKKNN